MSRPWSVLLAVLALGVVSVGCGDQASVPPPTTTTESASSTSQATQARVEVTLGHCFVEPVAFDGEEWNVPFEDQFGWGGPQPKHWKGTGLMVRTDQRRARYQDDGGAVVQFLLADSARVRPVETAMCD